MKKILLILLMLCSLYSFSQNHKIKYTIKIDSVTNINKEVIVWLQGMFGSYPVYNDSTGCFILNTDFDISQSLFTQKALDKNYNVLIFNKVDLIESK